MTLTRNVRPLLVVGALVAAGGAQAADDAMAIMKRAEAATKSVKTYQATYSMTQSMGQMGTMTMNMDIKTEPAAGKTYVKMTPTGQATGMMAMAAAQANVTIVDDGKNMFMLLDKMNRYTKQPHKSNGSMPGMNMMSLTKQKGVTFKLVGKRPVGGHPCYAIAVRVPPPPQLANSGMKTDATVYIDQTNYHMRQMKSTTTMPNMMGGQRPGAAAGAKPAPMVMTQLMVLKSDSVNAPIPASVFRFTPPAGAQEMQGGMAGMMGGMGGPRAGGGMGAPGGPPPPR